MDTYEAEYVKKQAREMLEKFYGYAYDVKITKFSRENEIIVVQGSFSEDWLGEETKSFTMKLDKMKRLLDFSVH